MSANKNNDGTIYLFGRYDDLGWGCTASRSQVDQARFRLEATAQQADS